MRLRAPALRASLIRNRRIAAAGLAAVLLLAVAGAGALMLRPSANPSPTLRSGDAAAVGSAAGGGSATTTASSIASAESTSTDGPGSGATPAPGASVTPGPSTSGKPGTPSTPAPKSTPIVTTMSLPAYLSWQVLPILLRPGDTIAFEANGQYWLSKTGSPLTVASVGCKGASPKNGAGFPAPELTAYALVGRADGVYFCIGAGTKIKVAYAGYLAITINDNTRDDDTGVVTIKIAVTHGP